MHQLPVHASAFAAALHDWQCELHAVASTATCFNYSVLLACKMNQVSQGIASFGQSARLKLYYWKDEVGCDHCAAQILVCYMCRV